MNIGQVASSTGMSVKMIRYYESVDLIQPRGRAASGYRIYSDSDVQVLRFIRQARTLGFSIERIRELLALWRDEDRASSDVKAVALKHLAELNMQIVELLAMRDSLDKLVQQCAGDILWCTGSRRRGCAVFLPGRCFFQERRSSGTLTFPFMGGSMVLFVISRLRRAT